MPPKHKGKSKGKGKGQGTKRGRGEDPGPSGQVPEDQEEVEHVQQPKRGPRTPSGPSPSSSPHRPDPTSRLHEKRSPSQRINSRTLLDMMKMRVAIDEPTTPEAKLDSAIGEKLKKIAHKAKKHGVQEKAVRKQLKFSASKRSKSSKSSGEEASTSSGATGAGRSGIFDKREERLIMGATGRYNKLLEKLKKPKKAAEQLSRTYEIRGEDLKTILEIGHGLVAKLPKVSKPKAEEEAAETSGIGEEARAMEEEDEKGESEEAESEEEDSD